MHNNYYYKNAYYYLYIFIYIYIDIIYIYIHVYIYIYTCVYIYIYPDMAKHQSKPQVYKSDIAPCGQI